MLDGKLDTSGVRALVFVLLIFPVLLLMAVLIICSLPIIFVGILVQLLFISFSSLLEWSINNNVTLTEEFQKHWKRMKLRFWIR